MNAEQMTKREERNKQPIRTELNTIKAALTAALKAVEDLEGKL